MDDLNSNWRKWNAFSKGKTVVPVEVDEYAVFESVREHKNHRDFVEALFRKKGYEVTRFGHVYAPDGSVSKWGLVFERADSEIRTLIFAKGIIGENIQPIKGMLL